MFIMAALFSYVKVSGVN